MHTAMLVLGQSFGGVDAMRSVVGASGVARKDERENFRSAKIPGQMVEPTSFGFAVSLCCFVSGADVFGRFTKVLVCAVIARCRCANN